MTATLMTSLSSMETILVLSVAASASHRKYLWEPAVVPTAKVLAFLPHLPSKPKHAVAEAHFLVSQVFLLVKVKPTLAVFFETSV